MRVFRCTAGLFLGYEPIMNQLALYTSLELVAGA